MSDTTYPQPPPKRGLSPGVWVAIGLGVIAVLAMLCFGGVAVVVASGGDDPTPAATTSPAETVTPTEEPSPPPTPTEPTEEPSPTKEPEPEPTKDEADAAYTIMLMVWGDQSASNQQDMCVGYAVAPKMMLKAFLSGVSNKFSDEAMTAALKRLMAEKC